MMKIRQTIRHPLGRFSVAVAALALLLMTVVVAAQVSAQSRTSQARPASAGDGRLLTVHDRGVTRTILTKATRIDQALADAGVRVDEHDHVEPARDHQLTATDYHVNIYRARPVVVVDGSTRTKVMTAQQTARQVAADANVALEDEDVVHLAPSRSILTDGASMILTVKRATALTLDLYGKPTTIRTQSGTVGELLREKQINLATNDRVAPAQDTPIRAGMSLRVWREGKQTITVEEAVEFKTEQTKDADKPVGYKQVTTPGKPGTRQVTYEIMIENGVEVTRRPIASVTTKEPVSQVEVVGAKDRFAQYVGGGSKDQWLAASQIPRDQWGYAEWLVQKESGWNPNAVNRSSGACGLAQALPCSKVPGNPHDPVNSLNWMNGYVTGRYGSWENAVAHSRAKGWY